MINMARRAAAALLLLTASLTSAGAQVPSFPQTLPADTVVGRLGTGPGPSQAIPFATLSQRLSAVGSVIIPAGPPASPANGQAWITSAGLFVRMNSTTVGPFAAVNTTPACATDVVPVRHGTGWSCSVYIDAANFASLQAAIDYAATIAPATVNIPNGQYCGPLTVTTNYITLRGAGREGTVLHACSNADVKVLYINAPFVTVENLSVFGSTLFAATQPAIHMGSSCGNCYISSVRAGYGSNVLLNESVDSIIYNSSFIGAAGDAILKSIGGALYTNRTALDQPFPVTATIGQADSLWASTTSYAQGRIVHTAQGASLIAVTGGTSGSSSPVITDISLAISDGSVTWNWIGRPGYCAYKADTGASVNYLFQVDLSGSYDYGLCITGGQGIYMNDSSPGFVLKAGVHIASGAEINISGGNFGTCILANCSGLLTESTFVGDLSFTNNGIIGMAYGIRILGGRNIAISDNKVGASSIAALSIGDGGESVGYVTASSNFLGTSPTWGPNAKAYALGTNTDYIKLVGNTTSGASGASTNTSTGTHNVIVGNDDANTLAGSTTINGDITVTTTLGNTGKIIAPTATGTTGFYQGANKLPSQNSAAFFPEVDSTGTSLGTSTNRYSGVFAMAGHIYGNTTVDGIATLNTQVSIGGAISAQTSGLNIGSLGTPFNDIIGVNLVGTSGLTTASAAITSDSTLTGIATPSNPAAGKLKTYFDTGATTVLTTRTSAGNTSNTVVPANCSSNQFFTGISTNGAITCAQVAAAGIAGQIAPSQGGTGVNNSNTITLGGNVSTAGALTTAGAFGLTLTATATTNSTLPAGTHTLAGLDVSQTWNAVQQFNNSDFRLNGATSGTITINCAATCGSNTLTLPAGTTDFSATGGTSQVVKQTSAGGAFTVAKLASTDVTNAVAGPGSSVSGNLASWNGTGGLTLQDSGYSVTTGTFTPNLFFTGNSTQATAAATGSYTKTVGASATIVCFSLDIITSNLNGGTGNAVIRNLPTTSQNVVNTLGVASWNGMTYTGALQGATQNASTIALYQSNGGTVTALQDTNFAAASEIDVQGCYSSQ